MIARALLLGCAAIHLCAIAQEPPRPIDSSQLKSGKVFAGDDVRRLQDDDLANPGMLWVSQGEALWASVQGSAGKSCATCHGDASRAMRGVAARFPKYDDKRGELVNLETRINQCRVDGLSVPPLAYESNELLALTAYVTHQSRSLPLDVRVEGPARAHWRRGRDFYHLRQGQMNLSCAQCHDQRWGKRLLAETISQGHGNAYPAYRLEWQSLGSLHRRFRSCLSGIRAELLSAGSPQLLDLELYLAWRARGLAIETPGVRR